MTHAMLYQKNAISPHSQNLVHSLVFLELSFLAVLGLTSRALHMVGKHSTTDLQVSLWTYGQES
jgi:hypothetical protein